MNHYVDPWTQAFACNSLSLKELSLLQHMGTTMFKQEIKQINKQFIQAMTRQFKNQIMLRFTDKYKR